MQVRLTRYLPIIAILLFAAYLRTAHIGETALSTDGSVHMLKALAMARDGDFPLIGTPMSTGLWHSPFPIYLYAIPAFFSSDPRLARLFTVAMNLIALCLVYRITHRYVNHRAAILGAFVYAMHPIAIIGSFPIWNPNLGAPFVFGYLITGLLGFYENKSWARVAHLPLLFVAGQMHPTGFLIAPLTPVLLIYAWITFPASRRAMLIETFVSGIAAMLFLLPWGIGLARYLAETGGSVQSEVNPLPNRGWGYLSSTIYSNLGGDYDRPYKPVLPILALIGAGLLIARLRRRSGIPALAVLLIYALMPILAWVIDLPYRDYHHRSCYPAAFIMIGVALDALAGLIRISQSWRIVGAGLRPARATAILQWGALSLLLGFLTYNYLSSQWIFDVKLNETGIPLRDQVEATRFAAQWSARSQNPLIILIPTVGAEPEWQWEVMRRVAIDEGAEVITVWGKSGVPLPETGAILIAPTTYPDNPMLLAESDDQWAEISISEMGNYAADWPIITPTALANGATILGVLREDRGSLPTAGSQWVVHLIWYVSAAPDGIPTEEQMIFVHLVDAEGNKYAQSDNPTRPISEWQVGNFVINRFVLDVSNDLPDEGALFLQFGMYGASGGSDALQLQIRRSGEPLATFDNEWELDSFAINTPLSQGQPLEVRSTWHSISSIGPVSISWELWDSADQVVFKQIADLAPGSIPADLFIPNTAFLRLPTDLPAGLYDLVATVGEDSYHREIEIIETRPRTFDPPEIAQPINAEFDDSISLYGYETALSDQRLTVTLDWFVREMVEDNYNFFVHVLADDGRLVAQQDSMPLGGAYPTFWWAAGEYIRDTVTLDLSTLDAGQYTIRVGWYDLLTLARLPVIDAGSLDVQDDALILDVLELD